MNSKKGFTLIELVIVLVVVGLSSAVAIPAGTNLANTARRSSTQKELKELQVAIMGDPDTGLLGFRDHIGALPNSLDELYDNSGGGAYPAFDNFTQRGWNGPYIQNNDGDNDGTPDVLQDGWGNSYVYNSGTGTITSWGADQAAGGGDDIVANVNL